MTQCLTCKHFSVDHEVAYSYQTEAMRVGKTWGVCRKVKHGEGFKPSDGTVMAFTMDASDYSSHLSVRSDFGCILHEPGKSE